MPMPSLPRVFVTRQIPENGLAALRSAADVTVWPEPLPPSRDALLQHAAGCAGLLTLLSDRIDAAVMDAAGPGLKVISNYAVGYNNIDVAEATRRGIAVGNTPGVLTDATADLAVALTLAAARCLVTSERDIRAGKWKTWEPLGWLGVELAGKTLGIVGLGRIGMATARRLCGGWGMKLLYHGRSDNTAAQRELGAQRVGFEELLGRADVISVHCSLGEQTQGMFNAAAFRQMKSSAVFVNTARGQIVVQDDLVAALRDGTIFAAGLDVTDPEPLPAEHPLMSLPNCVVTPHIGSATDAARAAMADIAAANLLAGLRGETLPHAVAPA